MCCSQLFDGQGGGLEFVAYDLTGDVDPANPLLDPRPDAHRAVPQPGHLRRPARRPAPGHLVVHKAFPFTEEESRGAAEAWGRGDDLTCVSLTRPAWRGVLVTAAKDPRTGGPRYGYAVDRGTLAQLDGHSALLWVAGNATRRDADRPPLPAGRQGHPPAAAAHPPRRPRPAGRARRADPGPEQDGLEHRRPVQQPARHGQLRAGARKVVKHENLPPVPYDYRLFM